MHRTPVRGLRAEGAAQGQEAGGYPEGIARASYERVPASPHAMFRRRPRAPGGTVGVCERVAYGNSFIAASCAACSQASSSVASGSSAAACVSPASARRVRARVMSQSASSGFFDSAGPCR